MVAQMVLVHLVGVRIPAGLPFGKARSWLEPMELGIGLRLLWFFLPLEQNHAFFD